MKVDSRELRKKIRSQMANAGHFFTVVCSKRTVPNTLRIYNAKFFAKKFLKGGDPAYDFDAKNLMCIVDMHNAKGFRQVNCDDIALVTITTKDGKRIELINDLRSYQGYDGYERAKSLEI